MADRVNPGETIHARIRDLYPLPRSLTGEGVRATLRRLQEEVALEITEVPSGTPVFDWTVPPEWNVREAWLAGPDGRRVVDFADSSLHLVGYSIPVRQRMSLDELRPHLYTLPEHPGWIPYRTSYYRESWGFCLPHATLEALPEGEYEVCIESSLGPGHLTYGEVVLPGDSPEEYLFSAHVCHPALCNDNLSGVSVAVELARALAGRPRRWTYRFLFAPGTIGAITWLARHEERLATVRGGLVLTGVGDAGVITYKRTRRASAEIDRAVECALRDAGGPVRIRAYSPLGYDERQFNSLGIGLDVGCLMRTPHGEYPEYHTSADDPAFVRPESLQDTFDRLSAVVDMLEGNRTCRNLRPKCEPQLGRRGLFRQVGGTSVAAREAALLWVLSHSDGVRDLLAIAEESGLSFEEIRSAADALAETDLLGE